MFQKLGEVRRKMDEVKSNLDQLEIRHTTAGNEIVVDCTASKRIKRIRLNEDLLHPSRCEELEELLETALNRALDKAGERAEEEMKKAGKDLLPGFPGL